MKRKWLVLLAIVSMLIFVVAGCAPEAAPPAEKPPVEKPPVEKPPVEKIVWKIADQTAPPNGSYASWGVKWFYDEIAKRSEGRFEPQYFWTQSLCPATEQPDGLKAGLMQSTRLCPAYHPSKTPIYNIAYIPCLFPFYEETEENWLVYMGIMDEWLQTPALKAEFAEWGGLPICETCPALRNIMGKVRIGSLADVKGVRMYATGLTGQLLAEFGAVSTVIPAPEIYDALSKGVISAVAHYFAYHYPYRAFEVSKYWTPNINLGQIVYGIVVGKEAYEALPADIKGIFDEVKGELAPAIADYWWAKRVEAVDAFQKAGIEFVEFPAEDNAKLRAGAKELAKTYVDKIEEQGLPGKEAFNSLQDIIKKHVPGYEPSYL